MRERAGADGRLLQTGVDIAGRLGQLAARRHFDGAPTPGLDRHHAACGLQHDTACGQHDAASAAGQQLAAEVSAAAEGALRKGLKGLAQGPA
jgi:hypothetical protein